MINVLKCRIPFPFCFSINILFYNFNLKSSVRIANRGEPDLIASFLISIIIYLFYLCFFFFFLGGGGGSKIYTFGGMVELRIYFLGESIHTF